MPNYLITGTNRGIGLEFTRQLAQTSSNTILACVRSQSGASSALTKLASSAQNIHILECDTSSSDSISSLASQVEKNLPKDSQQIDFLLNNAGINATPAEGVFSMTADSMHNHIQTNVLGPAQVVSVLRPFLKSGSVVMNMSSGLGSAGKTLDDIKEAKCSTYAISKAALDMVTVHQALELKGKGVVVVCMDPGWVKTDMGGEGAVLEQEDSVGGMLKCVQGLKEGDTAKFFDYSGTAVPW